MENREPTPTVLITAGPTHEPIDAVRYLGNRSSGRLGVALADESARRGWATTLLLGPSAFGPTHTGVEVRRFRSTSDLSTLLDEFFPACDVLVMAAAVSDFRPVVPADGPAKLDRSAGRVRLELEPTPDLVAGLASGKRDHQIIVGFALEERAHMVERAIAKLERKGLDAIVANPLETMDSESIDAVLVLPEGETRCPDGAMGKGAFAGWLLDEVARLRLSGQA